MSTDIGFQFPLPARSPQMPAAAGWTVVNGGTIADTDGGLYVSSGSPTTANNLQVRSFVKAIPTAPYTVTLAFVAACDPFGNGLTGYITDCGLALRESSSGKLAYLARLAGSGSSTQLAVRKWNTSTSFSGDYFSAQNFADHGPTYFQVSDDSTNRIWRVSADGRHFVEVHRVGRTDFLTPDQIGLVVRADGNVGSAGNSGGANLTVLSWKES